MRKFLIAVRQRHIVINALRVSLVVGSILNMLNQGTEIWAGVDISWGHIFMNYLVPYCVASYSAAKNEITQH